MTSFFHSYDLRGTYPDEISEEEAEKVGKAYGTFIDADEVLVGRDGRKHGEEITEAFISGILSTGTDVVFAGMVPSPVVYFGQVNNDFDSAAVVTASHNPPEYTGFKFNLEGAMAMSREGGMKEIEDIYEREAFETGQGERKDIEILDDYIAAVKDEIGEIDLSVVINCGNGVTGVLVRDLFEELGCDVKMINEEVDGDFPNHLADPGSEEAKELTKDVLADEDLGIIFDGDGDRAGFVLPESGYIDEDEVIALFSEQSLKEKKGAVVYDLRASKLVPEKVREHGGEPEETRVGHTFISERIHQGGDVSFAGELSGHFYFPAFDFPWDDGLFAGALMSKMVSEQDLEEKLSSFPVYPVSPELRIDCPQESKQEITDEIAEEYSDHETSTMDGVKIQFESGWALVRPSSTEPKMSVRCEADTEEDLEEILSEVETKVRDLIEKYS
ncbi:phosphomannomutase/phosphoglucomutase [Candidatus Nanohalobium constans]|uniref:Phosphomannomutase / phosphoglucomutase n=1 Tax=Candidatus Nanohalobium constans TaxID=2565781 RepID=A0A5Q0UF90_9ARCH|nr:phosphomannomutase/phosphoglucomutase [Candidatus Nanohalobium constans]QGA80021.1 phosphomannomutase / phosphoglucomutase [Candidatus Nanohalobium constans]